MCVLCKRGVGSGGGGANGPFVGSINLFIRTWAWARNKLHIPDRGGFFALRLR